MWKRLEGEQTFFSVDRLVQPPSLILSLVDPTCRQRGQTHSVSDEDDDVLRNVRVDRIQSILRSLDLSFGNGSPVFCIWIMKW